MTNFLKETLDFLKSHGKKPSDILWIGDKECYTTWEDFANKANFDYKKGSYPSPYDNWLIVGDDWWAKYDGDYICSWWDYIEKPIRPKRLKPIYSALNKKGTKWSPEK